MGKLLLTTDSYNTDTKYSFVVYDLDLKLITNRIPYQIELDCLELIGQGRPTFRPFGVTISTNYIFIASNSKIGIFDKKTYKFLGIVCNDGVINTHQILYYQGHIYRTNTSSNSISKINLKNNNQTHFCFKTNSPLKSITIPDNYSNLDVNHINSINIFNGYLYVISHNQGIIPSTLHKLDLDLKTISHGALPIGVSNHDLNFYKKDFITLSTGTNEVLKHSLNQNYQTTLFKVKESEFLRGSVIKNNNLFSVGNNLTHNLQNSAILYKYNLLNNKLTYTELEGFKIINDIHLLN